MDKKYIVDIKGKKFVTYNGLLDLAHTKGLNDMRVIDLVVDWKNKSAYCTVACKIGELEVMGVGSGTQENCGSMVKNHFVEMAHTRAKARALRDILNVDMVSLEELGDTKEPKKSEEKTNDLICSNLKCKAEVSSSVADYSKRFHGQIMCRTCQKLQEKQEEQS